MRASLGLARVELRARWRSLVALGLLFGLVGGALLGSLGAARRTATAYDRLERATNIDDVRLLVFAPTLAEKAAALPAVERSWIASFAVGRPVSGPELYLGVVAGPPRPSDLFTPILVAGRMFRADRVEEVVVTEVFARLADIGVGDQFPMRLLTTEEVSAFDVGFGQPDGPLIPFRVVGSVRIPNAEESFAVFIGSPALARVIEGGLTGATVDFLKLRNGIDDLDEFRAQLAPLAASAPIPKGAEEFEPFEETLPRSARSSVTAASRVLVTGLLSFAGVVLLVGGFVAVQAVARYAARSGADQLIERALGITRKERVVARVVPAIVPAFIGAALSIAASVAISPRTPIGSIAAYEPHPGLELNAVVMGAGGFGVAAAVVAMFGVIASRAIHVGADDRQRNPSAIAERVSTLGASAPRVVGLRFAFERGRGRTAVPVRSALIGATLGIAGVIAVASFGASLDRLVSTPARYGWQGDLLVVDLRPEARAALLADDRVADLATTSLAQGGLANGSRISMTGFETLRGSLGWQMLEGRMPATSEEVALGPKLAGRLGLEVGDVLDTTAPEGGPARKTVVGLGLGPVGTNGAFADQAVLTPEGFASVARTQPFVDGYIRLADGVELGAFADELGASAELQLREPPAEVRNLSGLGRLPDVLTAVLAFIAIAAIANALVVGVRRRRRDIAILRGLGFVGAEVARAVRTSSLAMAITSLLVGVPIGLVVGRAVWRVVAHSAYVAGDAAWPGTVLWLVSPAVVMVALAASALPAVRAARLRPAELLRTE